MKYAKKVISILMAFVLLAGLSACSSRSADTDGQQLQPIDERAKAEIRFAVSLLLDRNYIAGSIGQAGQQPASSFVAMGMTDSDGGQFYLNAGHDKDFPGYFNTAAHAYEENYAKAFDILSKYYHYDSRTGKFTDFPTITYLYNTSESHKAIAEYVQTVLGAIGIRVNLENQEWSTFLNTRHEGDYGIARNGWVADYNDPLCFLDMWTSDSGNNDVQLGKGEHAGAAVYSMDLRPYGYDVVVENGTWAQTYDQLIQVIRSCRVAQTRYALMHLAEDLLMSTGAIMPIYFYTDIYMCKASVAGFYANPMGHKYFHRTTVGGKTDSLSVCLASEPQTLDPALVSTVDGSSLVSHLFSGLARWEQDAQGKLRLEADCAQSLDPGRDNPNGTVTYTYSLPPELKWSDGAPLTARDFVYAWNRAASYELAADYGYMFEPIVGYEDVAAGKPGARLAVEALDDHTLQVTLNGRIHYWDELLAFPAYFPVRQDVVEGKEDWATEPETLVSNGAYTMTDWKHNSLITLRKNEHYYAKEAVTMEKLRFFLSDDVNNMLTNFKNGTWLFIDDVPTNEIAALKRNYPDEFVISGQIGTYYLCWNVNQSLEPK